MIQYVRDSNFSVSTHMFVRYVFACVSPLFSFPRINLVRLDAFNGWINASRATRQDAFLADFAWKRMSSITQRGIGRSYSNERSMAQALFLSSFPPEVGKGDPFLLNLDFQDELGEIDLQLLKDLDTWLQALCGYTSILTEANLRILFQGVVQWMEGLESDLPPFLPMGDKFPKALEIGERLREKLGSFDFHLIGLICVGLNQRFIGFETWKQVLSLSRMKSLVVMARSLEKALNFKKTS